MDREVAVVGAMAVTIFVLLLFAVWVASVLFGDKRGKK